MKNRIFVYGTLMREMSNHENISQNLNFVGLAKIDELKMYSLGTYPGIVDGEGRIKGEGYKRVLKGGLRESFSDLTPKEIDEYLENCEK